VHRNPGRKILAFAGVAFWTQDVDNGTTDHHHNLKKHSAIDFPKLWWLVGFNRGFFVGYSPSWQLARCESFLRESPDATVTALMSTETEWHKDSR
jgi:hypothetical protein